ncbi:MAG: YifB family Mg chelatase-like AAA ATPase [Clostridia bacterium]|nr:YifB family Mg chelatase-like AAA ATPase [Clostridia bacterium]
MISKVKSSCLLGLQGYLIDVESDVSLGLPAFDIVGLPDTAVKEARERVRAAIKNCSFEFPSRRYTVNLAPSGIKKEGPAFDLPIAVSILAATGQIKGNPEGFVFLGELSLSGEVRPVPGVLPCVLSAKEQGINKFIVPYDNREEAALVSDTEVYGVKTLFEAAEFIEGKADIEKTVVDIEKIFSETKTYPFDFSEVHGQSNVKRALEIAAAGGHNCLIVGSPGSGKTMLAQRLPSILPDLTPEEALETTKIYSVAGLLKNGSALITQRPFRAPHHSTSTVGLVGGGTTPHPGELSLAHNGVLFLDELPEFHRDATEIMRQPLEDGKVNITRASGSLTFPCKTMLVAAMNPCKCGYYGDRSRKCRCTESAIHKYLSRVSGPLLDRIDIQTEAASVSYKDMKAPAAESSAEIKKRVLGARMIQYERYKDEDFYCNAGLSGSKIEKYCTAEPEAEKLLAEAFDSMNLSARAHTRVLKVARTIADLEGAEKISALHIAEAIQYRSLDKKFWG